MQQTPRTIGYSACALRKALLNKTATPLTRRRTQDEIRPMKAPHKVQQCTPEDKKDIFHLVWIMGKKSSIQWLNGRGRGTTILKNTNSSPAPRGHHAPVLSRRTTPILRGQPSRSGLPSNHPYCFKASTWTHSHQDHWNKPSPDNQEGRTK